MRRLFTICLLLACASAARAQDQERKLADRLLRPDMSLRSYEQNKKFMADRTAVDKHATVGTFYLRKKSNGRTFWAKRDVSAGQFNTGKSKNLQEKSANVSSRTAVPDAKYSTAAANNVGQVHETGRTKETSNFTGNRPYLQQGKSQKSLSRENPPMTIEQVRELLNKNK